MSTIGSVCSGIGLLELGLERAGLGRTVWQVEQDEFCRKVLANHWPEADRSQTDLTRASALAQVRVVCGGFPCQPHSVAGKRKAQSDTRWIWPHFARVIAETQPEIVVIENVPGLRTSGLRDVLADLAGLGFDAEWCLISALDFGAPHLRSRLFIAATDSNRVKLRSEQGWLQRSCARKRAPVTREALEALRLANDDGLRRVEQARRFAELRGWSGYCGWSLGPIAPVDDGSPRGLAKGTVTKQRKALGNAVVVACAEAVGRAIVEATS